MADTTDPMLDLVELLDDQVDDITTALGPLLKTPLQDIAAKLPVVDKARLYVLTTYAIDSLIFSYLRLNGVNAKEHPVMRELERVKQYVKKINEAQSGAAAAAAVVVDKREVTLNKDVAKRFVKHDLAGNDKWDAEHAAEKAREKAAAFAKFEDLSRKIEKRKKAENHSESDEVEEAAGDGSGDESEEILKINDAVDAAASSSSSPKRKRTEEAAPTGREKKSASRKKKRQEKKEAEKAGARTRNYHRR